MRSILLTVAYRLAVQWWRIRRPVTMGVRVMLVRDGQVLLVKHTYQDAWYFPGGGMKRDEPVEAAARREAEEEVGAVIGEEPGVMRLVGVFANFADYKSDHVICFLCESFTLGQRPPQPGDRRRPLLPLGRHARQRILRHPAQGGYLSGRDVGDAGRVVITPNPAWVE